MVRTWLGRVVSVCVKTMIIIRRVDSSNFQVRKKIQTDVVYGQHVVREKELVVETGNQIHILYVLTSALTISSQVGYLLDKCLNLIYVVDPKTEMQDGCQAVSSTAGSSIAVSSVSGSFNYSQIIYS